MAEARVEASRALSISSRHTAAALAGDPWPDPASRDARSVSADLHEARMALSRNRDEAADAARSEAVAARARVGVVDRIAGAIGVRTAAAIAADRAEARAEVAESARDQGDPLRAELRMMDRQGTVTVMRREAERAAWQTRPAIAQATRQAHGDQLVRQAIAGGDPTVTRLAGEDLQAAREVVLRREKEEAMAAAEILRRAEAEAARQRQADQKAHMQGYGPQGGPRTPGRR